MLYDHMSMTKTPIWTPGFKILGIKEIGDRPTLDVFWISSRFHLEYTDFFFCVGTALRDSLIVGDKLWLLIGWKRWTSDNS